jgi:hypothetical protein
VHAGAAAFRAGGEHGNLACRADRWRGVAAEKS